jgi:excisionase family DNA binding protein
MEVGMEPGKLLNVKEAATRLGISPLTMRAWIRQRRLPFVKLGRRVLLSPQDVQRFIEANRIEAVSFDGEGL